MTNTKETLENYGIVASFDLETIQGKLKALNAKNGAGASLKDIEDGYSFTVTDVMQYKEMVDTYGKEQETVVSALFATDGLVYSSISETVSNVVSDLVEILKDESISQVTVKVVKRNSKQGQEFINLSVTA